MRQRVAHPVARGLLAAAFALAVPATAATSTDAAAAPLPGRDRLTSPAELEAFVDGVMAAHLPSRDIPAATIAVVKDGELFFAKGYGWADRERRVPVDPANTLFRPGSISKLFTWTAVMQLVGGGKIDLDADVNVYLKSLQVPRTFPQPITMKHLLAHTAGFEEVSVGLFARSAAESQPLRRSLSRMPARVRPPGVWSSYSNFGTALAGLIVEEVTGVPFERYIEENIFAPLGMENSTFREPLPAVLAPRMAVGYRRQAGRFEPLGFEFIGGYAPAGALSSTATDMARFMIAHLQLGRYGDRRILREDTARRMHGRLFALDDRLPGMAHGFCELSSHGVRGIGHGGDTIQFHSHLMLLPDFGVGLFVSYGVNGNWARMELADAFVARYFAARDPAPPAPPAGAAERARRAAGSYRFIRHNHTSIEKLLALPMTLAVTADAEGTLTTANPFLDEPLVWREVEPNRYRQLDGTMELVFRSDERGAPTHLLLSFAPFMPCYRAAWFATPAFNLALLGLAVALCVTTLVSFCYHRASRTEDPPAARRTARLGALAAVVTVVFLVGLAVLLAGAGDELNYVYPRGLAALLVLPVVATLLTVPLVPLTAVAWRRGWWTLFRRVHASLLALAALAMVWFYAYWNILGWQL